MEKSKLLKLIESMPDEMNIEVKDENETYFEIEDVCVEDGDIIIKI